MITARDDLDARAEGMRLGVSDFLAKPVFRRQLANRIRAQLDMVATARANDATLHQLQAATPRSSARSNSKNQTRRIDSKTQARRSGGLAQEARR